MQSKTTAKDGGSADFVGNKNRPTKMVMQSSSSAKVIRTVAATALICAALSLGGCFVYKVDVQQGNDITAQMVAQLEIGMTKREVVRIVGYPLINDPFHKDRWDYYYSKRDGKTGETEQQRASLKFTDEVLSEITSSF
ncbi:outer membrane protein assembly factor BamE [Candidatus Spongiihabitans sp.]|uniref:outer membrane protein assembly factor BamE n=1 Tax=Candidatus Spongiihabitans sp. TaxID=3101308 RepID=UPI003C7DF4DE